jgi:ribosomal protein L37AE/L43A
MERDMLVKSTNAEVDTVTAKQKQCKSCGTCVPITLSRAGILICTHCGAQITGDTVDTVGIRGGTYIPGKKIIYAEQA